MSDPLPHAQSTDVTGVVERCWPGFFTLREGRVLHRIKLLSQVNDAQPQAGEVWRITGEPFLDDTNQQFGWQLLAHEAVMVMPSGELLIDFLATQFNGIGKATATALWRSAAMHEVDLYNVLDQGRAEMLGALVDDRNRKIVAPDLIRLVLRRWQTLRGEAEAMRWMQQHGFAKRLARRAREHWGSDAVEAIKDNPYRLLAFAPYHKAGAAFAKVDRLATENLGVASNDPRRLLAAFECAMYQEWDNGNTAATLETLTERLDALLGTQRAADAEILCDAADRFAVMLNIDSSDAVLVQLRGVAYMERSIAERCLRMIGREEGCQQSLFQPVFDKGSLTAFEDRERQQPGQCGFTLNPEQIAAVQMVLSEPLVAITGGAGVGKTTMLKALFAQVQSQGGIVFQMALTGKAVKRLREATGQEAMTIAKYIRQVKTKKIIPPVESLYVIDEASMVDTATLFELFKYIPEGSKIVFVGDPYQLPPIGAGLTFHVMVRTPMMPKVELTEVHRAAADTGIPQAARMIREQRMPDIPHIKYQQGMRGRMILMASGVLFVEAGPTDIADAIVRAYRELATQGEVQIIAAINRSDVDRPAVGVDNLNRMLQAVYETEDKKVLLLGEHRQFVEGDPIIFTRNMPHRDLWNGSMGRLVKVYDRVTPEFDEAADDEGGAVIDVIATAEFDGVMKKLTRADFEHIELAYAITCHKSQGSAFRQVIVVSYPSMVMDNAWFYTAFTRARQRVVAIGDLGVMRHHATSRPRAFNRVIGLELRRHAHGKA